MKITINVKSINQDVATITGELIPSIKDSRKACSFKITEFAKKIEMGEDEVSALSDILSDVFCKDGYEYYYGNGGNILSKCPFREGKTFTAYLEMKDNGVLQLRIESVIVPICVK